MAELYNNPLNIEIINLTDSWSGQIGVYADGYSSVSDRKAKINYNPQNDRYRMAQTFTTKGGDVTAISEEYRKEIIEKTKNLSWQDARKEMKKLIQQKYPQKNINRVDFAKPFAHFDSRITGLRAGFRLFKGKGYLGKKDKYGNPAPLNNLRDIISRFAPGSENDVDAYVSSITAKMKKINPNFNGIVTEDDVPNMVRFFMEHENKPEHRSYYLTKEALEHDWLVAEWASQEDRPMSFTSKMFEEGYKQFTNTKIQKDELSNLFDSDGGNFSGGSRAVSTLSKEQIRNSMASNTITGNFFIQEIGSDLYQTGVGGVLEGDKDGIYGSAETILDDKGERITEIDFDAGFKNENIDINFGQKRGEPTSRIKYEKNNLTVQTEKRGDDRKNLIRYKRGGLEVEATERDGKKGLNLQYRKKF